MVIMVILSSCVLQTTHLPKVIWSISTITLPWVQKSEFNDAQRRSADAGVVGM